jgi:hypothetical protein
LKKTTLEILLEGMKNYAASRNGEDPKYTKHPATWLNGECWTDDDVVPADEYSSKSAREGREIIAAMEQAKAEGRYVEWVAKNIRN